MSRRAITTLMKAGQTSRRFVKEIGAATAIEYGLIASLVCIGIIASIGSIGDALNVLFAKVNAGFGAN